MDWQIIFVITTLIASVIGGTTLILKVADDFRKDLDANVKLLFKRFDAHKEDVDKKIMWMCDANDKKYTRIDNCILIQASFAKDMTYIREELTRVHQKLNILVGEKHNIN